MMQDFRGQGPPADIGAFVVPTGVMVFQHVFSGTTYFAAVRSGVRAWILVDYGTVPATVLNSAVAAGSNEVTVLSGTYTLATPIVDVGNNNVTFQGMGRSTLLTLVNGANCAVISLSVVTGWVIQDLEINGNGGNQAATSYGIEFNNVDDSTIIGVHITNVLLHSIYIYTGSSYNQVLNCELNSAVDALNGDGFFANHDCIGNMLSGNYIHGNAHHGVRFYDASHENLVVYNNIEDNTGTSVDIHDESHRNVVASNIVTGSGGICIYVSGGTVGSYDNLIANNEITGSVGNAIDIGGGAWADMACLRNHVVNNRIHNCAVGCIVIEQGSDNCCALGNQMYSCAAGIWIDDVDNTVIMENWIGTMTLAGIWIGSGGHACLATTIDSNRIASCEYGIWIAYTSHRPLITGNRVELNQRMGMRINGSNYAVITGNIACNNNQGAYAEGAGIQVIVSNYSVVSGNGCYDDQGVKKQDFGILLYQTTYCSVSGNNCTGNKTDGIKLDTNQCDDNSIVGNTCTANGGYGININNASHDRNRVLNNQLRGNTAGCINDVGTGTILPTVRACFVKELGTAAWIVAAASAMGIDIDAADEGALAKVKLPPDLQQVVRIKVWGTAQVAEADHMTLLVAAGAGGDNESWTAEAIAVASKLSDTVNFANLDNVQWTFTSADDSDIGDLAASDFLQWACYYAAASGVDCATDLLLAGEGLEIQYV